MQAASDHWPALCRSWLVQPRTAAVVINTTLLRVQVQGALRCSEMGLFSRFRMGRRTAAEIRDLASHGGAVVGGRQRHPLAILSAEDFALPSQGKGKPRQPLTATMSALGAARVRLGIPATASAGSSGLLGSRGAAGGAAASRRASSSASAGGNAGGLQAEQALVIAFDHTTGKLLYLMQWAAPFQHQPS